jgi:hypothetical protein
MFQCQGMFLKRGVAVSNRRVAGVACLSSQTEIRYMQSLQLMCRGFPVLLRSAGMKRQ